MGFFSPWFLAGIAAIGLPVYIHLLRRQTATPKPVSSLMFFVRGTQSSTKHRRLRYLLLFALRAALLILLVLAFANPFIRRAHGGESGRLLIVVVDNSFSMRAGSRFADAKQGAITLLASRPAAQRAQVMALGGQLQVLTQPTADGSLLRSALESIQPGDSHGNFGELGRGIRALTESIPTPIELHLFSDMQKTGMPANFADMVLPGNASLVLHPVGRSGGDTIPNWTVESIVAPAQLADPKDQKKSHVEAVIAGYGTPAVTRTVSLVVNGNVIATRKVDVPANGRAKVEFAPLDIPYGFSRCQVRIDSPDDFPADNSGNFSVKRSDPERILFVHQASDSRSPFYFSAAISAETQQNFVVQTAIADQTADIDPTKFAFVVISDTVSLPSIFENALLSYARNGGNVFIAEGTSAARRARIPVFGETALDGRFYSRDGGFATMGQSDFTHPVMGDSTAGESSTSTDAAGWSDLKFYYATVVDGSHSRVLARLADGTPLLLEKQIGEGHVLLFSSGLDNLTNDFPVHPIFVSFVDHAARYLSGEDRLSGSRLVDSFVQLRSAASQPGAQSGSVEIINPDGRRPLSLSEASSAQTFQLLHAGFYQVRSANGKDALLAVNPDRRESDMDVIPDDILQLWSKTGTSTSAESATSRTLPAVTNGNEQKVSIWWYIMVLAFAVAIAESILAGQYLGVQREEA